jgi:FKBP12-rapamycin complex-associated protein
VDLYINHESSNIKIETILTTSALLNRLIKVIEQQESRSLISMVSSSLRKLLDSALSDTDPNVRYYILNSLNFPQFNMYLALPENLNILFLCVRDERLEIRELSASIISKLSVSNSAYILPFVRKILMQLLIEIEIYPDLSSKETTVRLIGHLLSYTPRLVNLYAKPLLSNLHRKLTDYRYDIRFASSIITIVGQLASQSGPETLNQFDSMVPFIIESMQDFYYIQLKHTSLWTIGQIIVNTGYVIEPYRKYPSLLKILLDFLQNETNIPVRRETIRILGLIGAIDPFEYKRNAQLKISNDPNVIEHTCDTKYPVANQTKTTIFEPSEILSSVNTLTALEEYYPMLAINLLIKIIKNAIGITPRKDAIQALVYAMRNLDTRCANYVEYVIPPFLELIKNMNDNIVIDLITQLGHLVIYIKKHIDPYINGILDVVKFYWNMTEKQTIIIALIDLIQSIVNVMGIEYKKYLPETIPLILKKLQREILGNKTPNVQKLLHLTRSCSASMEFYVHLMLGQLIEFLNNQDVDRVVKQDIMFTIYTFSKYINLVDNVAILFQCFVKLFDQYQSNSTPPIFTSYLTNQRQTSFPSLTNIKINNQTDLLLIVLETQYIVAKQMGSKFSMYMPMFDKIILKKGNYLKFYEQLVTNWKHAININHSLLGFLTIMQSNNDDHVSRQQASQNRLNEPSVNSNPVVAQINTTSIQISNLRVRYEKAEQLTSRDAWRERYL